jgi:phospholipid/cholesterol/gamma-HCH transport system substrate-binding protein
MRNKKILEVAVGFFILAGAGALLMLAITVSGLTDIYSQNTGYQITADFNNIGGLKLRAKVSIAGVSVGRVVGISLDDQNFIAKVTMLINDEWHRIPNDSEASILTSGLLGDNYIGVTAGFSNTFLEEGAHIPIESTTSAIILEQLISKFVSNQASEKKP